MSRAPSDSDVLMEDGEPELGSEPLQLLDLEPPRPGQAIAVAKGVRWCRLPLPLALDHINVWLVDHADGCIVVDTGLNTKVCVDAWLALEREVLAQTPLCGVLVTHMHPDHLGLARWLQHRYEIPVWMSKRTDEQAQALLSEDESSRAVAQRFLQQHGITDHALGPQLAPRRFASMLSGRPEVAGHVGDGDHLTWAATRWSSLEVNGHAEGHICLHDAEQQVLISGDQVLPTISPNVGLNWRSRDPDPLRSFLRSLQRLSQLPSQTLVLPSHGRPFIGLQARARDLRAHHERQLAVIERACQDERCAKELLPLLFRRPLSGVHVMLALAETVAHVEHMVSAGRLVRMTDHGHIRYRSAH